MLESKLEDNIQSALNSSLHGALLLSILQCLNNMAIHYFVRKVEARAMMCMHLHEHNVSF